MKLESSEMRAVEEYGFEPPYVEQFKRAFGNYPDTILQKFSKLPTFERGYDGSKKWHMASCMAGTAFKVIGTEPGKRAPVLILLQDEVGKRYAVEPKVFAANFSMGESSGKYVATDPAEEPEAPAPKPPPVSTAMAEILKRRRAEAKVLL